jgi:hypothetical protein
VQSRDRADTGVLEITLVRFKSNNNPTAVFAITGFCVALPELRAMQFHQFLAATEIAIPPANSSAWTKLACKCGAPAEAVPHSIADRYHELGVTYQCEKCRDLERKSRAESTIVQRGAYTLLGNTGGSG